jgi:geranylgeranyl transferase type-2 subunit beta
MMLGLRSGRAARRVGKFMASMRDESGGWRASALSPCADIMSTYTGLTTLSALGTADRSVVTLARAFCGACERNGGGFGAMPLDTGVDVEYTYYGLGVRGLLAGLAGESQ